MSGPSPTTELSPGRARRLEIARREARRSNLIGAVSTVVVFTALFLIITNAPGWNQVRQTFFSWSDFTASFPQIFSGFWKNVQVFLIAEVLILVFALTLAVLRNSRSPLLLPLRILATSYVDIIRGIPTIILLYLLGFGMPALRLGWVPSSQFFWAITTLVVSYSAYVAEVYRAGLESVHESRARRRPLTGSQLVPDHALGGSPPGGETGHPTSAKRLRSPAEGLRPPGPAGHPGGVPGVTDLRGQDLQLHRLPGLGVPLPDPDHPPGPLHRLADRAAPPAHGGNDDRMTTPRLQIENLWKSFGDLTVLADVDLTVADHAVVCVIGASGSGKSTLLRCVNLLEDIDDGRILLSGDEISDPERKDVDSIRRRIGIVFQSFNLFPHLPVMDNITLAPVRVLGEHRSQAEDRARELLDRFGLADKANDYPDRLSGGQQQRVAIIRALAMQPELMLLDEVTSALDPVLVGEVLDIIRELKESGMTMLIATHEMGFARETADRVAFLHQGRVWEEAEPSQLFSHPQHPETQDFLARIVQAGRL